MNTSIIGFTLEEVCSLYSILPDELDEQSLELLREDLDKTCQTLYGKRGFIYTEMEVRE